MSWWSRIANAIRGDRLSREIDEELESHLREAAEEGRDTRLVAWLDPLHADTVSGWRQLRKNKTASVTAVLSLALAIGASTSAFWRN